MRRGHRRRADLQKLFENGHRESRALFRVRAGTELIEKQQIVGLDFFENLDDMRHMRGKGRQALLDALFVADIGVDVLVNRDDGVRRRRQITARLGHEHHEAERLHADGLAARVRTGDEQHAVIFADADVNRHDPVLRDERMARLTQLRASLAVELRTAGVHVLGKLRLGKREVDIRENLAVVLQDAAVLIDFGREMAQDALDFLLLGEGQLLDVVVELDDGHRLDEECRARGRLVVHDAGEARAVFLLYRNDVAFIAHRDDGILKILLVFAVMQDARDAFLDMRLRGMELAADALELDACVLADGAVFIDGILEQPFELAENLYPPRPFLERRHVNLDIAEKPLDLTHRVERTHDVHDFVQVEHGTHLDFL